MNRIAIIDDEKYLAEALMMIINIFGKYEVEVFYNAIDFLKRNEENQFDVVFSDLNLPGINGIECSQMFNENKPNKFILMTGECEKDINLKYKNLKTIDHFLYKPFDFNLVKTFIS